MAIITHGPVSSTHPMTTAKTTALVVGTIYTLVGLIGFFSQPVLGIFAVDALHNWIHLITGVIGLIVGFGMDVTARAYAKTVGYIYAAIALISLFSPGWSVAGLIEANLADFFLHLVTAAILLYIGYEGIFGGTEREERR